MANILFFMETCPDTEPFVAELKRLNIQFEGVDIGASPKNLKAFLSLRDKEVIFEKIKSQSRIGIPVLVHEGSFIFDIEQLKSL